jgi:hypothetical protein
MSIVSRVRRSEQSLAKPVVASTVANQRAPGHKSWSRSNCGGPAPTQRHSAACRPAHRRHKNPEDFIRALPKTCAEPRYTR